MADNDNTEHVDLDDSRIVARVQKLEALFNRLGKTMGDAFGMEKGVDRFNSAMRGISQQTKTFEQLAKAIATASAGAAGLQARIAQLESGAAGRVEKYGPGIGGTATSFQAARASVSAAVKSVPSPAAAAVLARGTQPMVSDIKSATQATAELEAVTFRLAAIRERIATVGGYGQENREVRRLVAARERELELAQQLKLVQQQLTAEEKATAVAAAAVAAETKAAASAAAASARESARAATIAGRPAARFGVQQQLIANYLVLGTGIAAITGAARQLIGLDEQMKNLQAITNTTTTGMIGLNKAVLDVSLTSKFMATDVAKAATILGQAGLTADQVAKALKSVATFSQAAGVELAQGVDIITSTMGAFNLAAEETKNVSDIFTSALNTSKLSVDQLTLGFQYSANSAAQLGVSYEELTTVLASLANAGIRSGSTLGTGLRALLVDLEQRNPKLIALLTTLGLTVDDIDVRTKGLIPVIRTLSDAGFSAAEAFRVLDTRGAATFVALRGQLPDIDQLGQNILTVGSASRAAATQMESFANTSRRLMNSVVALLAGALEPMIKGLQVVISFVADLVTALSGLKLVLEGLAVLAASRALSSMLGYLITLRGGGAAAALTGLATGAVGGGVATAAVGFARFLPYVGLGIVAITTLLGLLRDTDNEFEKFAVASEKAGGEVDRLKGTQEALNNEIDTLLTKSKILTTSQPALTAEIARLSTRFGELQINVKGTGEQYDQLISKMRDLQAEAAADLILQAEAKEKAATGRAGLYRKKFESQTGPRNFESLIGVADVVDPGAMYKGNMMNALDALGAQAKISRDVITQLKDVVARLYQGQLGTDEYSNVAAALGTARKLPTNGPDNYSRQVMRGLPKALEAILDTIRELNKAVQEAETARRTGAQAEVYASGDAKSLRDRATALIKAGGQNMPAYNPRDPAGSEQAMMAFQKSQDAAVRQLQGELTEFGKRGTEFPDAIADVVNELTKYMAAVAAKSEEISAAAKEETDKTRTQSVETLKTTLQEQSKLLSGAQSFDRVGDIIEMMKVTLDRLWEAQWHEFAEKQLKLRPGDYDVSERGGPGIVVRQGRFKTPAGKSYDPLSPNQHTDVEIFGQGLEEGLKQVEQTWEEKTRDLSQTMIGATIKTLGHQIDELDRYVSTALTGVKDYTPYEDVQEKIKGAIDNLYEMYLKQVEQLGYMAAHGDLGTGQERDEEVAARLKALRGTFEDRKQDFMDKAREEKNRPVKTWQGAYDQMRQSVFSELSKAEDVNQWANTFKNTALAAVTSVRTGFADLFTGIATGSRNALGAIKEFTRGILQSMLQVISNKIAQKFTELLFNFVLGSVGAPTTSAVPWGFLDPNTGLRTINAGGYIDHAMGSRRRPVSTRDSIKARLRPGEYVLREAAVQMVGRDALDRINAMGNSAQSQSNARPRPQMQMPAPAPVRVQNDIYVIPPQAQRQLSPNDVIVTITDDMARGGMTKQMVKSIVQSR